MLVKITPIQNLKTRHSLNVLTYIRHESYSVNLIKLLGHGGICLQSSLLKRLRSGTT